MAWYWLWSRRGDEPLRPHRPRRKAVDRSGLRRPSLRGERLEPRLALAITLPIQDVSGLTQAGYDVWVTGHGIPGWQAAGAVPLYLMSLDSSGSFSQTATAIASAVSTGTTATITTQAPHGLQGTTRVFIAGIAVAGYDGAYQATVTGPTTFTYTTATGSLAPATANQGTAYSSALLASVGVSSATSASFDASSHTGLATVTTAAPHGLSAGQTVEISGVTVAGYNGVFSVAQTPSATTFQVTYAAPAALDPAGTGGTLESIALEPVRLSQLPPAGITLDAGLTRISAKLLFFVAPADSAPNGLPFSSNQVTPTDPKTAPYDPGLLTPTSIFDIVEFAYLPWGATEEGTVATITTTAPHGFQVNESVTITGVVDAASSLIPGYNQTVTVTAVPSPMTFTFTTTAGLPNGGSGTVNGINISGGFSTFDVTAVDGLAIPMNLTASRVKTGNVDTVGIRPEAGFNRQAIGQAFLRFMANDPLGHVDPQNLAARDFSKLLYQAQVTRPAISGITASWSGNVASFTYSSLTPILQYEWVEISGFTGAAAGYNGPYQVQTATATTFTVTNTDSSLPSGASGTVTPLLFQGPAVPDGQFVSITAPKDWLGNQVPSPTKTPPGLASQDSLATFWDETINNFFASGKTLSIYLGKETTGPIYSGSSDGTQYTLSNGLNTYHFPKPAAGLASALYVWSQANAPAGDEGLLQDQIWQALCRGVALDGVNPAPIQVSEAQSTSFVITPHSTVPQQGLATITTSSPHGLQTGAKVIISGVTDGSYNGPQTITRTGDKTFTFPYLLSGSPGVIQDAVGTYDSGTNTTTVTVTMQSGTAPSQNEIVYLTTNSITAFNGQQTVTGASSNTFTFSLSGDHTGTGNGGNVWGGLYAAGTGGTVEAGGTSTAWNDPTKWYTQHTSAAFPHFQSVYCPYSKFLHYSTLQGTVDKKATKSIYLHNAAYAFGEDENPIGNPYTGPLVPPKMDGTVYDGTASAPSSVTIRLLAWGGPTIVSGDFNGDGLTDVASFHSTTDTWTADLTSTSASGPPTQVTMATWPTSDTWSDFLTGDFTGDGKDDLAGRNQAGAWQVISMTGGTAAAPTFTSQLWITEQPAIRDLSDLVVGDFDGDGHDDIAGRRPNGTWWYIHDSGEGRAAAPMARWTTNMAWSMIVVGNFTGDASGRQQIAGRNTNGVWWMISYDTQQSAFTNTSMTPWSNSFTWGDAVVGDFTGDGRDDIAARRLYKNDDPSKKLNSWFVITRPATTFQTSTIGKWPGDQTWLDIRAGDFLGNGLAGIAGRSASTGNWRVLQKSGGSYASTDFGGAWSPAEDVWQVFAGHFDPTDTGPHKKKGLLGRANTGTWLVSVSNGSSFTTTTVPQPVPPS